MVFTEKYHPTKTKLKNTIVVSALFPLQVDVVYVGTIHPAHCHCVKVMLQSGKAVLCEKPLTMNINDTKSLIQTAKDCGVFLMEVDMHLLSAVEC